MIELILESIEILKMKDVCKKCLVKASCSKQCREKQLLDKFIYPYDNLKQKKLWGICFISVNIFLYISIAVASFELFFNIYFYIVK